MIVFIIISISLNAWVQCWVSVWSIFHVLIANVWIAVELCAPVGSTLKCTYDDKDEYLDHLYMYRLGRTLRLLAWDHTLRCLRWAHHTYMFMMACKLLWDPSCWVDLLVKRLSIRLHWDLVDVLKFLTLCTWTRGCAGTHAGLGIWMCATKFTHTESLKVTFH